MTFDNIIAFLMAVASVCASAAPRYELKPIVTGLEAPVYVTTAPGDRDSLYVVLQAGQIVKVTHGKVVSPPVLDIRSKVAWGGEMGLLGLAFHPKFAENGRYFIDYTVDDKKRQTIVAERNVRHPGEREWLRIDQPYSNHKGGQLAFGPDGRLYIGMGDGGSAGDPYRNGQNQTALLGKILTLDVEAPKAAPEIFALGLRNPWRFTFDPKTQALFVGDVGQNIWEEIDIVEKGGNYGWNVMEGKHCYPASAQCNPNGLKLPIWEYPHENGENCIIGGQVYRGKKIPELEGAYVYGDFGSGRIWALYYDQAAKKVIRNVEILKVGPMSSFGVDADGEILPVDYTGKIWRLEATK
jgi:glucose/arabinose dehydrogenase